MSVFCLAFFVFVLCVLFHRFGQILETFFYKSDLGECSPPANTIRCRCWCLVGAVGFIVVGAPFSIAGESSSVGPLWWCWWWRNQSQSIEPSWSGGRRRMGQPRMRCTTSATGSKPIACDGPVIASPSRSIDVTHHNSRIHCRYYGFK